MKREIIKTADGSTTIYLPQWDEHYHSKHGAIQEAYHVFIRMGLDQMPDGKLSILEIGFGTGLNALITCLETRKRELDIEYSAVEAYPVSAQEIRSLNYTSSFPEQDAKPVFELLHQTPWGERSPITGSFHLHKRQQFFSEINETQCHDLIFFDAFGPRVQPDLWTVEMFEIMYRALRNGGILVTYSAKGSVRRAMEAVGFIVERLPGPPGKREMLRAQRPRP